MTRCGRGPDRRRGRAGTRLRGMGDAPDRGERTGRRRRTIAWAVPVALGVVALIAASGSAVAADAGNATNGSFDYDGDRLTVEAGGGRPIAGETTLPAGERVTVRLRSSGDSPFLRSPRATVGADGEFEATVDLSRVAPGATFEATLLYNGTTLATAPGLVTDCERGCEPTPTSDASTDRDGETDPGLTESVVHARRGTTATIGLDFHETDVYVVTIGSADVNYRLTATVRDEDGDGTARLLFNTANAGQDPATVAVADDDAVTVTSPEPTLDEPIHPSGYDIRVASGVGSDAATVDLGTLVVSEAANGTVTPEPIGSATVTNGTVGDGGSTVGGQFASGLGAIALGGLLAVVGLALVLGFVRP